MTGTDYIRSAARTVLYAYAYVALEWLFLVTKPSFLSTWPPADRLNILLAGALPFVLAALALHALLCLVSIAASRSARLAPHAASFLKAAPSLITVAIALMLLDNFTYTMFGWGIVYATAYTAPAYWAFALLVFILHLRRQPVALRHKPLLAGAIVLASGAALLWLLHRSAGYVDTEYRSAWDGPRLPNIIMFASDGVTADHMSAYGYSRATTPNLDAYMDRALVADHAFTNSVMTTGSLSSMMTGKHPATTKLLLPPHTLKGKDAYQHLPRILRKLGYRSMQETVRYYADGADLNWQESFDMANGRAVRWLPASQASFSLHGPLELAGELYERLSGRIGQLLFIRRMVNSYADVTSQKGTRVYGTPDTARMARVFDFIRSTQQPFFIHIHLMDTHCCRLRVAGNERHFQGAGGLTRAQRRSATFDDAILRADGYFGQMMDLLKQQGELDDTLVVFTSDHDKGWDFRSPVPLVFLFPGAAYKGRIAETTQLLDVAPTILDYLKVGVPKWMEGQSLLHDGLPPARPVYTIFQIGRVHVKTEQDRLARAVDVGPPSYGLETLGMVVCDRWYLMNTHTGNVTSGAVGSFNNKMRAAPGAPLATSPCNAGDSPEEQEAGSMMHDYLEQRGFSFDQGT
jgi:arylsulfatase A-like enzyme